MLEQLRDYWRIYGGLSALFRSVYFLLALPLTLITAHTWTSPGWWGDVISILPSLLGFTIGGFAIFLGVGDERFRALIGGKDPDEGDEHSPFLEVCGSFVHFAVVQFLALLFALICSALYFPAPSWMPDFISNLSAANTIAWGIGYFLFMYGLLLAIATVLGIFRVATWYDEWRTRQRQEENSTGSDHHQPDSQAEK